MRRIIDIVHTLSTEPKKTLLIGNLPFTSSYSPKWTMSPTLSREAWSVGPLEPLRYRGPFVLCPKTADILPGGFYTSQPINGQFSSSHSLKWTMSPILDLEMHSILSLEHLRYHKPFVLCHKTGDIIPNPFWGNQPITGSNFGLVFSQMNNVIYSGPRNAFNTIIRYSQIPWTICFVP